MNVTGRIALVTGAGSGIGKRTALLLWEAGYSVVLAGRRVEPLEQTVQEAGVPDSRALVMPTDVSDPAAVSALFAAAMDKFGRLDVLFNNAGLGAPGVPLEELRYEQWRTVLDTCVTGTFLCTQHAFRIMKGRIRGTTMIYHLLLCFTWLIVDLFASIAVAPSEKDLEIILLCQQLRILERKLKTQPRLSRPEKLMLVAIAARFKAQTDGWRDRLNDSLLPFKPDTLLKWHRELVRQNEPFNSTTAVDDRQWMLSLRH
jgi:hypothetical protein